MQARTIKQMVSGRQTTDGAGVVLTRVLDNQTTAQFDPFLMLDSFDSVNPEDYLPGFPTHPHRGIETITYLVSGSIAHQDSLGNRGVINAGDSQWMTAGSGILHQEMPQPSSRMLGIQLWLNLRRTDKMKAPHYLTITKEMIPVAEEPEVRIHVISGTYRQIKGITPLYLYTTILDIELHEQAVMELKTQRETTCFVFSLEGSCLVDDQPVTKKTAVLLTHGDFVKLASVNNRPARILFFEAPAIHEPIAWGGPIVMNTNQELQQAFAELRSGDFIRHR
ncbi:MAG: pirin family protein [Erysipelotrichaceae bacterium]|nr:pirin family protein [Erysipelotrichaceae bacterium]